MSKQSIWDKTPDEVKAKYLEFEGASEFSAEDVYNEDAEFADILKAMQSPFYCEQADQYQRNAVEGVKTEEKAIDLLVDGSDKYGDWQVFKFADGKWLEAKIKRKGKSVDLVWAERKF